MSILCFLFPICFVIKELFSIVLSLFRICLVYVIFFFFFSCFSLMLLLYYSKVLQKIQQIHQNSRERIFQRATSSSASSSTSSSSSSSSSSMLNAETSIPTEDIHVRLMVNGSSDKIATLLVHHCWSLISSVPSLTFRGIWVTDLANQTMTRNVKQCVAALMSHFTPSMENQMQQFTFTVTFFFCNINF